MKKTIFTVLLFSFFSLSLFSQEKTIIIKTQPENCNAKIYKWVPFKNSKGETIIEGISLLKISEEKIKNTKAITIEISKDDYISECLNAFYPFQDEYKITLETSQPSPKTEGLQTETKGKIAAISTRTYYTVVLKNDGTVVVWGYNHYGQCNVLDECKQTENSELNTNILNKPENNKSRNVTLI